MSDKPNGLLHDCNQDENKPHKARIFTRQWFQYYWDRTPQLIATIVIAVLCMQAAIWNERAQARGHDAKTKADMESLRDEIQSIKALMINHNNRLTNVEVGNKLDARFAKQEEQNEKIIRLLEALK